MGDANYCFICGQPWRRHSGERCDEVAEQSELEEDAGDPDEEDDEAEEAASEFGSRLDDGFRLLSGHDDD